MENYSNLDKLLHKVVLSSTAFSELIFDIEKSFFLPKVDTICSMKSIFVLGLARAGTTTLMREIYFSDEFASLTYKDMPFVMSPNLWGLLTKRNKRKTVSTERAHGDGILVNPESPEALEEVFWKTFDASDYIREKELMAYSPSDTTLDEFERYQKLICLHYDKQRYLSKNNNNILRLRALAKRFPDSKFLLIFRDPVTHAQSLLKQHRRFSGSQGFVKDYMFWLSHFEFGDNHRPFSFSRDFSPFGDPDSLEYWLSIWQEVYSNLLILIKDELFSNIHSVCYENLCSQPEYWKRLCDVIQIPLTDADFHLAVPEHAKDLDKTLIESTYGVYNEMKKFDEFSVNI